MDSFDTDQDPQRTEREAQHNLIDSHVGGRMRLRRAMMGLSQERLADALGLTFQQVQKYERGVNRVSASRLFDLARILEVPISFFFDDMSDAMTSRVGRLPNGFQPRLASGFAEQQAGFGSDPEQEPSQKHRETLELSRAFQRIRDENVRRRVIELIKAVGSGSMP
jgi:transcriptional regulator with XRE-family HTH domain